ncbi:MAG: hypothetical protein AB8B93_14980 [Pseudomonadales bacterium]
MSKGKPESGSITPAKPLKLQRPLHRQRGRPRTSPPIRNTEELKAMLNCSKTQLPERLREHGIDFHRDSAGNYWAALDAVPAAPNKGE